MSLRCAIAFSSVIVACAGCGGKPDEATQQTHEAESRSSAHTQPGRNDVTSAESAGGEARPAEATATPERLTPTPTGSPEDPDDARDESNLDRVLGVAATAAERAPRGRDLCETALFGLKAMLAAVERETGNRAPPPEHDAFLEACRAMPRPVQQCLVPTYAFERQEECERIVASAPEDARQRLEAAVRGQSED